MKKVAIGASTFAVGSDQALKKLEQYGIEVAKNPYERKLTKEETIRQLQDAEGLLAGLEVLDEDIFSKTPKLKAIARIGVGMDNVDVEAASQYGIKVSNTPDAPTDAVAETALASLLTMLHKIIPSNVDMHLGVWKKRLGYSVQGMNVLLIGYGRIGQRFAEHLRHLGANILIYDPYRPDVSVVDMNKALNKADIVSVHALGTEEIITKEVIAQMKDGVILMNCARGAMINEQALYEALNNEKVSQFWGDVFQQEPYHGMLIGCENAILTPHIASNSVQCREVMEMEAVQNLLKDLGYVGSRIENR